MEHGSNNVVVIVDVDVLVVRLLVVLVVEPVLVEVVVVDVVVVVPWIEGEAAVVGEPFGLVVVLTVLGCVLGAGVGSELVVTVEVVGELVVVGNDVLAAPNSVSLLALGVGRSTWSTSGTK